MVNLLQLLFSGYFGMKRWYKEHQGNDIGITLLSVVGKIFL